MDFDVRMGNTKSEAGFLIKHIDLENNTLVY